MTLVRAKQRKQRCKMTPPRGQGPVTCCRLPALTGGYRRIWPPPNKYFKQNGQSQQQIKYL
eukprot:6944135-Heterocapsa_arctica.AAC.1